MTLYSALTVCRELFTCNKLLYYVCILENSNTNTLTGTFQILYIMFNELTQRGNVRVGWSRTHTQDFQKEEAFIMKKTKLCQQSTMCESSVCSFPIPMQWLASMIRGKRCVLLSPTYVSVLLPPHISTILRVPSLMIPHWMRLRYSGFVRVRLIGIRWVITPRCDWLKEGKTLQAWCGSKTHTPQHTHTNVYAGKWGTRSRSYQQKTRNNPDSQIKLIIFIKLRIMHESHDRQAILMYIQTPLF